MFLVLEICGQIGYIQETSLVLPKYFLKLFGNIFASWEANFVFTTMFPEVGKHGNTDRKHNVFAKMLPSVPRGLGMKGAEILIL